MYLYILNHLVRSAKMYPSFYTPVCISGTDQMFVSQSCHDVGIRYLWSVILPTQNCVWTGMQNMTSNPRRVSINKSALCQIPEKKVVNVLRELMFLMSVLTNSKQ